MIHMSHKEAALDFLTLITTGKTRDAYDRYIHPDFRHHNQYHKGDAASLLAGMLENDENFPEKEFVVKKVLEEGDTVMAYSSLKFGKGLPDMSVMHLLRFQDNKVIEMWDCGMQLPADSPNENGVF